ncbi:DUF4360 domain-containing protein [Streptomyces sp. UNOC14_S4]|uniref:DUF4360 domain-containing protein n=1 Tax=Streptomyces sp. UNOC14_S4 TaxID=2872340 RepID=UPI001E58D38B|nr:DUF4360 domain-containing protein [Streptomyces sp. UNOC14_S4]MCC3769564.1 DUF4360 domain-containing protein [Streptomyces sp. UNOC14_S4]
MPRSVTIAAAAAALMAAVFPSAAHATGSGTPPPGGVSIEIATVNGSGCPMGDPAIALAPGYSSFTLSNVSFTSSTSDQPAERRKNCQINLYFRVPQGYTYAIAGADLGGFASLAKGASGVVRNDYYFQGSATTVPRSVRLVGPYNDAWQMSYDNDLVDLVYAPCGEQRNLNLNTSLQVDRGTSDPASVSTITLGDDLFGGTIVHRLAWKRCPGS